MSAKLTERRVKNIKRDLPKAAGKFRLVSLPDDEMIGRIKEASGVELEVGDLFYVLRDSFSSDVLWHGKTNRYWADTQLPCLEFVGYVLVKTDLDRIEEVHDEPF